MNNNIKLPRLESKNYKVLPFSRDYVNYVLIEYLFKKTPTVNIDKKYYLDDYSITGNYAAKVLDYFGLILNNGTDNLGFYENENVNEIANFLLEQNEEKYQIIGQYLLNDFKDDKQIALYRKYYNDNIKELKETQEERLTNLYEEFLKEFPLEKIKTMNLKDYALGLDNSKSFCYSIENGKYKNLGSNCGFNPKGASSWGIYYSKDKHSFIDYENNVLENPEDYWVNFRTKLYNFLKSFENDEIQFSDSDQILKKMPKTLIKLCFLYWPMKFIDILTKNYLTNIFKYFGLNYNESDNADALSFKLNKYLRNRIPELNENNSEFIAITLLKFMDEFVNKEEFENYSREDFLKEIFIDDELYDDMVNLLKTKKNIILRGAPGVGKTFMAKRLAYSIMEKKDNSRVKLVQFHQNYSYEDFVEGYRPNKNGFDLEPGIFKSFCKNAESDENNPYFIIIDEINRGNLSKIFGELLMLIEGDKRDEKVTLNCSKKEFSVPENIYIIGAMNTADKSLTTIDYALKRRFSYADIDSAINKDKFINEFKENFDGDFAYVLDLINDLNKEIETDISLGNGFKIGHSYFCQKYKDDKGNERKGTIKDINIIIKYEIIPLIEEYWDEDEELRDKWVKKLKGIIK